MCAAHAACASWAQWATGRGCEPHPLRVRVVCQSKLLHQLSSVCYLSFVTSQPVWRSAKNGGCRFRTRCAAVYSLHAAAAAALARQRAELGGGFGKYLSPQLAYSAAFQGFCCWWEFELHLLSDTRSSRYRTESRRQLAPSLACSSVEFL